MRRSFVVAGAVVGTFTLAAAGAATLRAQHDGIREERAIPVVSPPPPSTPTPTPSPTPTHPAATKRRSKVYAAAWTGPPRPSPTCGTKGARVIRFRIEVDRGLPTTPERFTDDVLSILCDERSWIASGHVRFRYEPGGPLLIGLRTKEHKDKICYPYTGYGSCQKPGQVVINADRWFGGSKFLPLTVSDYRRLVINHEVGHAIGQRHRGCPAEGAPAPVMMQQSLGLTTDGRTCRANPWPLSYELRTV
jgi:uncharacterized protein DUF3152